MRNLKYNASGGIDLEYDHPVYGWIPSSVHPNDAPTAALYAAAIALGGIAPKDPPPALTAADFTSAVQSHLDSTAHSRNYDGILSACSYATSTNLTFSVEGKAAAAWRDAVWLYCYQQLALVKAGTRIIPASTTAFIAELPKIVW